MADTVDWDSVYKSNYENTAFSYTSWIKKAKDLIHSADLFESEINKVWESRSKHHNFLPDYYTGTYFMLKSYAIENIFKAEIILRKKRELVREFQAKAKFPENLKSHKLIDLAEQANFSFTKEQEDLLKRLTRSALWYGRYPIPLKYTETKGAEIFEDGKEYSVSWFGSDDVKRINKLIDDLKSSFGFDI